MASDPMQELKARTSPVFLTYQFCCIAYLLIIALTYGTLIVYNPSFHIDDFYVPALNKPLNLNSTLIFFNLIIHNEEGHVGFRYNAVNLTFSYITNTSSSSSSNSNMVLATYTVPGFYQGMNKKTRRRDVAIVTSSLPWQEAALGALSGGSKAEFRVDLATNVRLKNWFWYFKHRRITAGGIVKVDDSGKKESKESVELKSSGKKASKVRVGFWVVGYIILILVGVSFIILGVLYFFQIAGYRMR